MMTVPDPSLAGRPVAAGAAPDALPEAQPARRPASAADLLDLHGAEVYRHLRRLAPTADDAADLHQETFLRAHRAWATLPADANHRAWLHRIAANVATDAHRRRAARGGSAPHVGGRPGGRDHDDHAAEPAAGARSDPAAAAEGAELRAVVRDALGELPPRERTAVIARVLEGRDHADVAVLLDCTETNARQLTSRGLRRLRALLAPHLETDR
jgi:RNA polymerase sigma-70 factor, ECF subfamily